jgi:hypothetical protein
VSRKSWFTVVVSLDGSDGLRDTFRASRGQYLQIYQNYQI